jgi:meiotically up-regulated gene 157 (Mug157) protein
MADNSNLLTSARLTRRAMLCSGLAASVAAVLPKRLAALPWNISQGRPVPADRKFSSPAIEEVIARVKKQIPDPVLATMFERCFPNTLDTTVFPGTREGHPDTFVITGDIDAMWQRDSSAQVHPYLPYAKQDPMLKRLLQGVVRRQVQNILIDPYANAFMRSPSDPPLSWTVHDRTDMKPSVGERKWEVDSLCYTIRLAHGYWKATGDTSPFDAQWEDAAGAIVRTFREQQRFASKGPYSFQRLTTNPLDTTPLGGYGNPARPVGMIFSMFRPSDDCCTYPLFVPANLFAMNALTQLQELASEVSAHKLANDCEALLGTVRPAVQQYARVRHQSFGEI